MTYNFNNSIPIYLQIIEFIKMKIISGELKPGEQLNSVRLMAQEYEVNPNTIQRALSELENKNLVFSIRTKGRYVTKDVDLINKLRDDIALKNVKKCINILYELGYKKENIYEIIKSVMDGDEKNE